MHEPAYNIVEEEYIQWDYGKGYVDALADTGLDLDRRIEVKSCPWCQTPLADDHAYCPRCGRSMGPVRLYQELIGKGMDDRDARALLVRAGFEPI
jgi:predicted amidophosphoribosyltransferase